jgi:hypothetical protein
VRKRCRELEAETPKTGAQVKRHLGNGRSTKSSDRSRSPEPKPHRGK